MEVTIAWTEKPIENCPEEHTQNRGFSSRDLPCVKRAVFRPQNKVLIVARGAKGRDKRPALKVRGRA
jgi:hypothetical protein